MAIPDQDQLTREEQAKQHIAYCEEKIQDYLKTGEISSGLSLDACLAVLHSENNWDRIWKPYADHERKWFHVFRKVASAVEEIQFKAKEFEFKHWMGFCDDDVKELMVRYRQWQDFDWKNASEAEANDVRDMWNPHDFDDPKRGLIKKHWGNYFKRRVRKPLQALKGEFCSTDADVLERLARIDGDARAAMEHMKIMMGGSAGRVLLTIQDRYSQGDPRSIYGGAWVTLIFDETSEYPRGGVQGHCATKDEALRLIQDCIDYMPALFPDNTLCIA